MMTNTTEQLLSSANPVVVDPDDAHSERADDTLHRILDAGTQPSPARGSWVHRPWRYVLAAAGAALVVALVIQLSPHGGGPAFAVTPSALTTEHAPSPDGASADLLALATKVADLPDDVGTGPVAQVSLESWSLFTRVDGKQVTSKIVPQETTFRTRPDGTVSEMSLYTYNGKTHDDTETYRNHLPYGLHELSSDDAELARQLAMGQPTSNGTRGTFDSIVVANRQLPIEPATRAAILRHLATADDIETVGDVRDRLGRQGVGFTVDSQGSGLPTRYMLIFDPSDGRLLGYEETLTSDPGKLNIRTPAVIQYTAFKDARYVDPSQ